MLAVSLQHLRAKAPLTFTEAMPIRHAMKTFRSKLNESRRTIVM